MNSLELIHDDGSTALPAGMRRADVVPGPALGGGQGGPPPWAPKNYGAPPQV
jgi:hypothetical protein